MRKVKDRVFEVGAIDWDRTLFDELVPLPDGTSYNSYLIIGSEKIALIDTVEPYKKDIFFRHIDEVGVKRIDYLISNHAEQDHSGSIPYVLERHPDCKVVTNPKCKAFLMDHLHIDEDRFIEVKDGETLSLGDKTLEFIYTPWVHWPETMSTYLIEDKILFSCDFFGSHRATSNLFVKDEYKVVEDAKRYYAEIMMPFRKFIERNIEKIEKREIEMIAPSHGPVYDKPSLIIDSYKDWISERVENRVLIPFVSMHDSTEHIVNELVERLMNKGVEVIPYNLIVTDVGELAMALVDAATVIFGSPYVLGGLHPQCVYAAYLTNALRPKTKFVSIVGSYGWGGKGVDQLKSLTSNLKAEWIEPFLVKGLPGKEDFEKMDIFVEEIVKRHKTI